MAPAKVEVGDLLRFGDEIEDGLAISAPGQVIKMTPTSLTIRKGQPMLFYNSGVIHVKDQECILKGHPLVTLTYQRVITGDIVQGIPKIEQLFEGANVKDKELGVQLSTFARSRYLKRRKKVLPSKAFDESVRIVQRKIIENIQKVYLSQGVNIADIHFEVIVRRMTSWGKIRFVGDSGLFRDETIPLHRLEKVNAGIGGEKMKTLSETQNLTTCLQNNIHTAIRDIDKESWPADVHQRWLAMQQWIDDQMALAHHHQPPMAHFRIKKGSAKAKRSEFQEAPGPVVFKQKAIYEPVIVGITATASNGESFLSAASFQETSRVLARDAIFGKTDFLRGVKERVILGDLILAGTGFPEHILYAVKNDYSLWKTIPFENLPWSEEVERPERRRREDIEAENETSKTKTSGKKEPAAENTKDDPSMQDS
jgi:DNA-directed RNA polymerase subunit beta'